MDGRQDHPVVHVAWNLRVPFSAWAEKRIPSEIDWKYAALAGLERARHAWWDRLVANKQHRSRI